MSKKKGDCQLKKVTEYGSRGNTFEYLQFTNLHSKKEQMIDITDYKPQFNKKFNELFGWFYLLNYLDDFIC